MLVFHSKPVRFEGVTSMGPSNEPAKDDANE
jgi:hypothetical protein